MDEAVRALLDRPNFAHVATTLKDGSPHAVAVWSGTVDGDKVGFFTQDGSLKARNLRRDGRVAISVIDHDDRYEGVQIRGHVVEERTGDDALAWIDEVARRHTGADFPMRQGVLFVIEPERVNHARLPFKRA
jgi:PPOX class probable F420-dependent enzyme